MADPFRGRTALVTGAASGIGRSLCHGLAARGAAVVAADVNPDGLAEAEASLRAAGADVSTLVLDVRDQAAVTDAVQSVAASRGRLDLLFNNAGVNVVGTVDALPHEDWDWMLDVNLRGVLHGVRAAWPVMKAQGGGHIVNTASVAGLVPVPTLAPYAMTKHAVVGLTTSLRAEGRRQGIRVSVLCPGFVNTPLLSRGRMQPDVDRQRATDQALRFSISPEACAKAALRGVAANRARIVVSGHARLLWWAYRLSPGLFELFTQGFLQNVAPKAARP